MAKYYAVKMVANQEFIHLGMNVRNKLRNLKEQYINHLLH